LPLAIYYVLHAVLGLGLVTSLGLSSVLPVIRSGYAYLREREVNTLALLIVSANVAGILLTFVSGNARVMFAKNSGISSVIALGILYSVVRGRPLMTAGLQPFITRGDEARAAAWERLAPTAAFRRYENRFSIIWGALLLAECVARLICAFTVAPSTMVWFSDVLLFGTIVVASIVSGGAASSKIDAMVTAEAGA
jgi:intracellular septation protein A